MSRPKILTTSVRWARRMPGYRKARRAVLGRVRSSRTARDIVTRIYAGSDHRPGRIPQRFPAAGNLLAGVGVDALPVTVISMVGMPVEQIEAAVREIARYQLLFANFRPVFLLDQPEFAATRRFGYPTELIVHRQTWDFPDQTWMEYASARLRDITRTYGASTVLQIPRDGVNEAIGVVLATGSSR